MVEILIQNHMFRWVKGGIFWKICKASQEEGIVTKIRKSLALWYSDGQKINEPAVDVRIFNKSSGGPLRPKHVRFWFWNNTTRVRVIGYIWGILVVFFLVNSPIETNCQCSPFSMLGDDVSNGVQEHSRANDSAEDEEELLGVKFHRRS